MIAAIISWSIVFPASTLAVSKELVIYYPGNEKVQKAVRTAFNKRYPNIKIKTVSLSNWPMVQRVVAERNNPAGDCSYSAHTMSAGVSPIFDHLVNALNIKLNHGIEDYKWCGAVIRPLTYAHNLLRR